MKEIKVKYQEGLTELEYLEKIYKKVKLRELVKFNGKAYRRLSPRNNIYYKCPNHFYLIYRKTPCFSHGDIRHV